jgi:[acyl-carrier-protein] S-malonyltransferase
MGMKAAMIFPGQGSQFVGMGKDLVENFPRAAEIYREADETLRYPISRLCFQGAPESLKETRNAQPAILLHSIAAAQILREEGGIEPAVAAGHSLGEYSALVVAGVISAMDALKIVRKRGELMFSAGMEQPGTMAALIGLDRGEVESICGEASGSGEIVVIANINSPGQTVISGHTKAVEKAIELAEKRGAKKVVRLNVSGAFHSPLVASAQEELVSYIEDFTFSDTGVGVICNADAKVVRRKEEIIDALSRQLTSPVLWSDSMKVLINSWEGTILEVGPGRVLTGLMKRIDRGREVRTAGTAGELEKLIAPAVEFA